MADITLPDIMNRLCEHVERDEAEVLLAVALEKLGLEVQPMYSPAQVMAIGAEIADFQRQALAESDIPEARELEKVAGPFIDAIKADAPHLNAHED
jgi:hypothetical protein